MASIGIICGLKSEARIVRSVFPDERVVVAVSGANAQRAGELATALCDSPSGHGQSGQGGVGLIISVGISGGLLPAYEPGDLVIGREVITAHGETLPCDPECLALLGRSNKAAGINPSIIYGSDEVILSPGQKHTIHQQTGAKSVDMESHGCARAAAAAGVPFLGVRAIADRADRALPQAALNAVKPDGGTRIFSTLINAARDPIQFSELIQLGIDSRKAHKTLSVSLGGLLGVLLLGSNFS